MGTSRGIFMGTIYGRTRFIQAAGREEKYPFLTRFETLAHFYSSADVNAFTVNL